VRVVPEGSPASIGRGRRLLVLLVASTLVSCGTPSAAPSPDVAPTAPPPATSQGGTQEGDGRDEQDAGDDGDSGDTGKPEGDVEAGDDGRDGREPQASSDDARGEDQDDSAAEDASEREPERRSRTVAWILGLGPSAPTGPSAFRAYALLERADCEGLLDRFDASHPEALQLGASEDLYRATALACLAATDSRSDLWDEAEALAARAGAGTSSCLDLVTRALLDDLLTIGQADPTARLVPGPVDERHAPPCPRITSVEPAAGQGGTVVTISGQHLDRIEAVELRRRDADQLDPRGSPIASLEADTLAAARAGGGITLEIPSDVAPGPLCVLLRAVPDWDADGAPFDVTPSVTDGSEDGAGDPSGQPSPCPPTP
jgi:hypothetical protein